MGTDLTAAAAAIVRTASARPPLGGTRVIGIEGRSGSGKTTFAQAVVDAVVAAGGRPPQVLHMDDLYPGWDGLDAAPPILAAGLAPLAEGRAGRCPTWDWATGAPGGPLVVEPAPWLVVEGVGCGAAVVRPLLAALAWLDAARDTRYARAIARDGEAYLPHWSRWAAQEDALLARDDFRSAADLVVRTDEAR